MEDSKQKERVEFNTDSKSYLEWNQILARQLAEWMRIEQERRLPEGSKKSL